MSLFREIGSVTRMSLASIPQRLGTAMVIVVGIGGVVAVLVSVLAMAVGFEKTLQNSGRLDRAIVLRNGATSELGSAIGRDAMGQIVNAPGIRKAADGQPIVSAEAVVTVELPQKGSGTGAMVTLRGVGPQSWSLRPEIHLTAGRAFEPGKREIVVGIAAQRQFRGLAVGDTISIRGNDWKIVGAFESQANSHESELLGDAETVLDSYRRTYFNSVTVFLESPGSFELAKTALKDNPSLLIDVRRETDYYASISAELNRVLTFVAYVVGSIMAIGAVFGALNTMYSAVSVRTVEIATLRAIGFGSIAVVISVFVEALLLALAGGLIGAAMAWLFFNGNAVNTLSGNLTQVAFRLDVTPELVMIGLVWAALIGLVGGLFPAIKAARQPIASSLRAL